MKQIGPYQVVRELGRGGMGVVYEATDPHLGRRVALKQVLAGAADGEALLRFGREAELLARVRHRNVIEIHELGRSEAGPYLVMELVGGESLAERLRRGPLPPEEAVEILSGVAAGVAALHGAGIVHRDLKPENVLLRGGVTPVLLDFGLARELDARSLTETGALLGTPAYMAPEQALGQKSQPETDLYALGALLYACLHGHPPYEGPSALAVLDRVVRGEASWDSALPSSLVALGRGLMASEPRERAPAAGSLGAALEEALGGSSVPSPGLRASLLLLLPALALAAALLWPRPATPRRSPTSTPPGSPRPSSAPSSAAAAPGYAWGEEVVVRAGVEFDPLRFRPLLARGRELLYLEPWRFWILRSKGELSTPYDFPMSMWADRCTLSADGRRLAVSTIRKDRAEESDPLDSGEALCFEIGEQALEVHPGFTGPGGSLAWRGTLLFSGAVGRVSLYDTERLEKLKEVKIQGGAYKPCFMGESVVFVESRGKRTWLRRLSLPSLEPLEPPGGIEHVPPVRALLTLEGDRLLVGDMDGRISLYDARLERQWELRSEGVYPPSARFSRNEESAHMRSVVSLVLLPDGRHLASLGSSRDNQDATLRLWDLATRRPAEAGVRAYGKGRPVKALPGMLVLLAGEPPRLALSCYGDELRLLSLRRR